MGDAAVTYLLEKVWNVGQSYVNLIEEDQNELRGLENDLRSLKAFLEDSDKKPNREEFYKETDRPIRELVYDAEDTIDTCLSQQAATRSMKFWGQGSFRRKRVSLARELRSIRESMKPMLEKADNSAKTQSGQGSGASAEERRRRAIKPQSIREDNIVGLEDEEAAIINYLMEPKESLDVISIIGMHGLGKTTLAWKIFQNKQIRYEFPVCIWVYVSQAPSRVDVLLKILRTFTSQDMPNLDEKDLIQRVRGYLEDEKFFLVLDDVWTAEAWNDIQVVLPKNNSMSKVVITSCDMNVGSHANPGRRPHRLRFLTDEESWQLLQLEVFGKLGDCPHPELERIGESIAKGCDGLPLAVVVIGGILLGHLATDRGIDAIIEDWNDVSKNLNKYLATDGNAQAIPDIVALSYSMLPRELRDCFLYLGVFPEDYMIPTWTLTRLWIAEGFIQQKPGRSLEEIAEDNLKELIDRNLVMVDKRNPRGEVKTCRVHDIIRAFCISKAAEQNLFQEIKLSRRDFNHPISDINNFRRLCIHSNLSEFLSKEPKGPRVRSFLCFNKASFELDARYTAEIPDAFKLLRVLHSKSFKVMKFPRRVVTKLIQLRYVTLSIDDLDTLPEEVSELYNLETLVVDTHSRILTIEGNIWKMVKLRHLKTKAAIILAIKEGEAGGNLQTLSRLSPDSVANVIYKAGNLKRLGIRGKLATLFNTMSLEKLGCLENLNLQNDLVYESASADRLHGLPRANCFPPFLKRLTLSNTFLDWKHMSTLAKIDTLEVLKLKDNAFIGILWNAATDGFATLQFLAIMDTDLVIWEASTNPFPRLRSLVLKNCTNLKEIPECLRLAEHLEELDVENVRRSVVDSARKIEAAKRQEVEQGEDKWRVQFKLSIGPGCQQ